jgi:hypothetical protein
MKKLVSGQVAAVLLLAATSGASADREPALQMPQLSAEYAKWRGLVLPTPSEQSYRTIPWRASVLHGIVDAQKNDKPIMLVLMNGHPLGCT